MASLMATIGGDLFFKFQFVRRHAKNISIHDGHAVNIPIPGDVLDFGIDSRPNQINWIQRSCG